MEIDPVTGETRIVEHLPSPREFLVAVARGDCVYTLGGEDSQGRLLDEVVVFAPKSGEILEICHLPSPRARAAATALDGDLFLFGGWNGKPMDEIVRIKLTSQGITAEVIGFLPEPAADRVAVTVGEKFYLVGGADAGFKRQIAVLEIDPQATEMSAMRFRGTWLPW